MDASSFKGEVDFGIITIRADEFNAVLRSFSDAIGVASGRRLYNLRRVTTAEGVASTVAVIRCVEQGTGDAQDAARDLLEELSVKYLLIVGIAGGVPTHEFTLGDVVVSTRVLDFSLPGGGREHALSGGMLDRTATRFVANLPAMADKLAGWNDPETIGMLRPELTPSRDSMFGDDEWKEKVSSNLEHHFVQSAPRPPRVITGAIASSDRLVKDDKLLRSWLRSARQIVAVEMESAGIYRAAQERNVPFFAIRGISDMIGYKRDPAFTDYACRSAAAFAHAFLKLVARDSPIEETAPPAPVLPGVSRFTRFIGRDGLAEQLTSELLKETPSPVALVGPAGIGKSTLALAVMHRNDVVGHYGDRRWFVPLDTAHTADAALGLIASAIQLPYGSSLRAPCSESTLRARVRGALGTARSLLVLDHLEVPWERDFRAMEEVLSELAAMTGLSLVVAVRGKQRPESISWGQTLELQPFDPEVARELFFTIAPEHREQPDVGGLLAPLGGVPLAITLLGYRAQGNDLQNLKREWHERETDLLERDVVPVDRLSSWNVSIELSIRSDRMIPEARRLASLLAALPDGIAQEDLSEVFPTKSIQAADVLSQLGLAYSEGGRLRQLPPIRIYWARVYPADPEDLDWAMGWYGDLARGLGPKVQDTTSGAGAVARLVAEAANLDAVIRKGLAGRDVTLWIESAISLGRFACVSGQLSESLFELAKARAEAKGDLRRQARCIQILGDVAYARSQYELAKNRYEAALPMFRRISDTTSEANCIQSLGDVALQMSQREEARRHYETARRLYEETGSVLGKANCILCLGQIALRSSQHEQARELFESARSLYRHLDSRINEAYSIQSLGDIALLDERFDEAKAQYEAAQSLLQQAGDVRDRADCIRKLGEIAAAQSHYDTAGEKYQEALTLYRRTGDRQGEASCIRDLGVLALHCSRLTEAEQRFQSARDLARTIGDRLGEAHGIRSLGDLAERRSDRTQAQACYQEALSLYKHLSELYWVGITRRALARIATDPAERARHVRAARFAWLGIPVLLVGLDKEFGTDVLRDRITEIRIDGLRTLEALTLKLGKLTVLIGENGSGKSSIIEACELLRRASTPSFFIDLHNIHGGLFNLLRDGATDLRLAACIEGEELPLAYEITLSQEGTGTMISREHLTLGPPAESSVAPIVLIDRNLTEAKIHEPGNGMSSISIGSTQSILGSIGLFSPHPGITRMQKALQGIEVHLPFEVLPAWAAHAHDRRSVARTSTLLQNTDRLDRLGGNLANAFHALRTTFGEDHWQTTMEYVRIGLGDFVESVNTVAGEAGGAIALSLKVRGRDRQIPAAALADGVIAYLAFVALFRLNARNRTLLAFDEPELHLHPALLVRVVQFFEAASETHPVVLATHSDRLLDALHDPARAVRICELDTQQQRTRIRELDPDALSDWIEGYRGLGDLHGAGYLSSVLKLEDPA